MPEVTRLIGASIPRAGHHFLVDLMRVLLEDALFYCEFYAEPDCCRLVPCVRGEGRRVVFQKHHDLDLDLRPDLPGVLYVVQTRDPVMSALSDREHMAQLEGEERAGDRDAYVVWLGRKAFYYEGFVEKWVRQPRAGLVVEYDDLVADPAAALRRVTAACGLAIDDARVDAAVAAVAGVRAAPRQDPNERFTRRTLPASRFLDPDLLPAFESLLLDRLPELRPRRRLEAVGHGEHPVACVYLAERARAAGDHAESLRQIDRALAYEPRNRHLLGERAVILNRLGRTRLAVAAASAASALAPDDPACLRRLSDLHVRSANETLGEARAVAERLVALRPGDPGHLIHLATICLRLDDGTAALGYVQRALAVGSGDPYVWRYASEILKACRRWDEAVGAAERAIALAPHTGELHHHHANVLMLAGRPAEATAAHRRALELEPDRANWHWKLVNDLLTAGERDAAREAADVALARFPDDPRFVAHRRSS